MDRSPRLAELVVHLTGCQPNVALDAVARSGATTPGTVDDALLIVAKAMYSVQHVDLRERVDLRETNEVHAR